MMQSDSINELAAAFAKAQKQFPVIERGREVEVKPKSGGSYTFCYAEFSDIRAAVKDVLSDNGLSVVQSTSMTANGNTVLITTLMHASGQWMRGEMPVRVTAEGPQAFGSALTYAKRYAYTSMLGLATEDDDDGNGAEGNSVSARPARPPAGPVDSDAIAEFKALVAEAYARTDLPANARKFVVEQHDRVKQYGDKVRMPTEKQLEWLKNIVSGGKRPAPAPVSTAAAQAIINDAPPSWHDEPIGGEYGY